MLQTIEVPTAHAYQVHIGHALSEYLAQDVVRGGATRVLLICQPSVLDYARQIAGALESVGLVAMLHQIPDAEQAKTVRVAEACWEMLGEHAFARNDAVVGVGGGAATDLAGFVAACWMRGIKVYQVPTTLLAMVDAAVGGKTGVNSAQGKNLVGAFHEPRGVYIDLDSLATLPRADLIAGSAEIIKTGFIADPVILDRYEEDPHRCIDVGGFLPELIARSVAVKARVVAEDLTESSLREILNYGHTFGHAVELCERYQWAHGRAVAVGMMFVANLAHHHGRCSAALVERHRSILSAVGLPVSYAGAGFADLLRGMQRDKKNRGNTLRFVIVTEVGKVERLEGPSEASLRAAYEAITQPSFPSSKSTDMDRKEQ